MGYSVGQACCVRAGGRICRYGWVCIQRVLFKTMHDRHRGPVGRPQQHLQSRQGSLFPCNAFLSARCASVNVNFHFLILPTPPRAPRCARIRSANGFFHYQSSRQHTTCARIRGTRCFARATDPTDHSRRFGKRKEKRF